MKIKFLRERTNSSKYLLNIPTIMTTLEYFPPEVLAMIDSFSSGITRIMMSLTCKVFADALRHIPRSYDGEYSTPLCNVLASLFSFPGSNRVEYDRYERLNVLIRCHADLPFLVATRRLLYVNDFAFYGRLDVLTYIAQETRIKFDGAAIQAAVRGGHVDCVRFLLRQYEECAVFDHSLLDIAAENGRLECLIYLHHEFEFSQHDKVCYNAARNGHLECLQYAHENGAHWGAKVFEAGILSKSQAVLDYLEEECCPIPTHIINTIACTGDIEKIKQFRERGYPILTEAINSAICYDHFDCLKYLLGCFKSGTIPWKSNTYEYAQNKPHMLQYIREMGYPAHLEVMSGFDAYLFPYDSYS